jgi:hypothetical protein
MLTKNCLLHLLDAVQSASSELEELVVEKEWYVTSVTDKLDSAEEIILGELETIKSDKRQEVLP